MSTQLMMTTDVNGINTFGLEFAEDNYSVTLAADTEKTVTVPDNFKNWLAVFAFESGSNVWVSLNSTAEVPDGTGGATTSQLCPTARSVKAGDVIHFITGDTSAQAAVSFYYR